MSNSRKGAKRLAPLSLRLTAQERKNLAARAGDLPLSTYIKGVLFGGDAPSFRRGPRSVSVDRQLIAQVLAALGSSRLASNLSQIAKYIHLGNLIFDQTTKDDLRQAAADISAMRALLMHALGKDVSDGSGRDRLSSTFEAAATQREASR
jgi:hypothetical protein